MKRFQEMTFTRATLSAYLPVNLQIAVSYVNPNLSYPRYLARNIVSFPPCPTKPRLTITKKQTTRSAPRAVRKPAASAAPAPRPAPVQNTQPAARAAPPPPPPPPAAAASPPPPPVAPSLPQYKALYPFQTQEEGEVSFEKDDILEIVEKDENGWWLARKDGREGWVPSNYLEEYIAPKPAAAPPPPPPARRPAPPAPAAAPAASNPATQRTSVAAPTNAAPVAVMPGVAAPTTNGVPPWKAQLEARKAAAAAATAGANGGSAAPSPSPRPASSSGPVPAARRTPPAPGPKPVVPAKPNIGSKPPVPSRPGAGGGAPTPAPRAPPRPGAGSPANALADAVSGTRFA